ncbi:hypothetical protein EMCRGX_G004875 [Ephydatia muelleri]
MDKVRRVLAEGGCGLGLRCIAHILHKAVGHSLDTKGVKEPVVALSTAISHIKKSNILTEDLALMVRKLELKSRFHPDRPAAEKLVVGGEMAMGIECYLTPITEQLFSLEDEHYVTLSTAMPKRGRHNKPIHIDVLCEMWAKNDFVTLWNIAKGQAGHFANLASVHTDNLGNNNKKIIDMAISLARNGLYGKVCHTLLSNGIACTEDSSVNTTSLKLS